VLESRSFDTASRILTFVFVDDTGTGRCLACLLTNGVKTPMFCGVDIVGLYSDSKLSL
jgi:hypothetical protein